ncbi:hypothetical protein [Streptomyces collinus]|uniref:hypothetical protein n=1 Tax=Streptomyces collinus TaxID=42684 RepID=UPI00368394D6
METFTYTGPVYILAKGTWHTAQAELSGTLTRGKILPSGHGAADVREQWGGYLTMPDAKAAYEVYEDDEGRRLRIPAGKERTFLVPTFSNPMNIKGDGTVPFD